MNYRVTHRTEYAYAAKATLGHNEARLIPRDLPHQVCSISRVNVEPAAASYRERVDFFGNQVSYFSVEEPHDRLAITATSEVRVSAPATAGKDRPWDEAVQKAGILDGDGVAACFFMFDSPLVAQDEALADYARPSFPAGRPLLEAADELMRRIYADFEFDPESTTVSTPLKTVLQLRRGVCQDFAHLALGCLRSLGLPARYVSGYIETLPPPGKERLVGADASHAWFSVFAPACGWVDFDPTNGIRPADRHITVAWGRDYSDVAPLKGVIFGGGTHVLDVMVDVEPLGADAG